MLTCEVVEKAAYRYSWRHLKEGDGRRESEREEWRCCWKELLVRGGKGWWEGGADESVRQAIIELRPWPRSSATFHVKHHGIRPEIPRLGPCLAIRILRSASCHLCLAAWILLPASCYPRQVFRLLLFGLEESHASDWMPWLSRYMERAGTCPGGSVILKGALYIALVVITKRPIIEHHETSPGG